MTNNTQAGWRKKTFSFGDEDGFTKEVRESASEVAIGVDDEEVELRSGGGEMSTEDDEKVANADERLKTETRDTSIIHVLRFRQIGRAHV